MIKARAFTCLLTHSLSGISLGGHRGGSAFRYNIAVLAFPRLKENKG